MFRNFFAGIGYLFKGFARFGTNPGLMWLGVLPALIVGIAYTVGIVALAMNLDAIVSALTSFAHGWPTEPLVRIAAGLALVVLVTLVLVSTFTALTLAVGGPFYERIWRGVEASLGEPAQAEESTWASVRRGVGNGLRLFVLGVVIALIVLLASLIPVVGWLVAPALGAFLGGWVLALELTAYTFDARKLWFRDRRRLLSARRARTIGFGVATYLMFLVPFVAILVMPAAVVGATLLAHDALRNADALRGERATTA